MLYLAISTRVEQSSPEKIKNTGVQIIRRVFHQPHKIFRKKRVFQGEKKKSAYPGCFLFYFIARGMSEEKNLRWI